MTPMKDFQETELEEMPIDIKDNIFKNNSDQSTTWLNTIWDTFRSGA